MRPHIGRERGRVKPARPRPLAQGGPRAAFSFFGFFQTLGMFSMTYVYLTIFAIIGAFSRYGQTLAVQAVLGRDFPWATLSVNVLGCFLMGFLFFATLDRVTISPELRTGILTGGLGAYTTFSTFSVETLNLFETGEPLKAVLYVGGSVALCLIGVFLGAYLSRNIGV